MTPPSLRSISRARNVVSPRSLDPGLGEAWYGAALLCVLEGNAEEVLRACRTGKTLPLSEQERNGLRAFEEVASKAATQAQSRRPPSSRPEPTAPRIASRSSRSPRSAPQTQLAFGRTQPELKSTDLASGFCCAIAIACDAHLSNSGSHGHEPGFFAVVHRHPAPGINRAACVSAILADGVERHLNVVLPSARRRLGSRMLVVAIRLQVSMIASLGWRPRLIPSTTR